MMTRILLALTFAAGALAQTANFPAAELTDGTLLVASNRAQTTLTLNIDDATLAIPVASGAVFQAAGSGSRATTITIGNEILKVCSIAGNTLTICAGGRGYEGTTPATHLSGATVRGQVTAFYHNQLREEVKAIGNALRASVLGRGLTYSDGAALAPLAEGTSGQYLRSAGAGAPPTWSANPIGAITQGMIPFGDVSAGTITGSSDLLWDNALKQAWVGGILAARPTPLAGRLRVWGQDASPDQVWITGLNAAGSGNAAGLNISGLAGNLPVFRVYADESYHTGNWNVIGNQSITQIFKVGASGSQIPFYHNYLKRTGVGLTMEWKKDSVVNAKDYDFSVTVADALGNAGAKTVNLTAGIPGVIGANVAPYRRHFVLVDDGSKEIVEITGGTCNSGTAANATACTITFTTNNPHPNANWTLRSATAGMQEAIYAWDDPHEIYIEGGTHTVYAPTFVISRNVTTVMPNHRIRGAGSNSTFIVPDSSFPVASPAQTNETDATWNYTTGMVFKTLPYLSGSPNATEQGPSYQGFAIHFTTQYSGTARAQLKQWIGIDGRGVSRQQFTDVAIYLGWIGIDLRLVGAAQIAGVPGGNPGGSTVTDLRTSTYSKGLWIDGAVDSVRVKNHHHWPFLVPTYSGVHTSPFNSIRNYAVWVGRADDLHIESSLYHAGNGIRFANVFGRGSNCTNTIATCGGEATATLDGVAFDWGSSFEMESGIVKLVNSTPVQFFSSSGANCDQDPDGAVYQNAVTGCLSGELLANLNTVDAYNGAADIVVRTVGSHYLQTGDLVTITNLPGGYTCDAVLGTWSVTRLDASSFSLNDSTGRPAFAGQSLAGAFARARRHAIMQTSGRLSVIGGYIYQGPIPNNINHLATQPSGAVFLDATHRQDRTTSLSIVGSEIKADLDAVAIRARITGAHTVAGVMHDDAKVAIHDTYTMRVDANYASPLVSIDKTTLSGGGDYTPKLTAVGNSFSRIANPAANTSYAFWVEKDSQHTVSGNQLNGWKNYLNDSAIYPAGARVGKYQAANGLELPPSIVFADLAPTALGYFPAFNGFVAYCRDCGRNAGAKNECTAAGTGAWVMRMQTDTAATHWVCFQPWSLP